MWSSVAPSFTASRRATSGVHLPCNIGNDDRLVYVTLGSSGDGTIAALTHNGQTIWTAPVGPLTGKRTATAPVSVVPGDRVEFILSPKAAPAGDRMHYRFQMSRSNANPATC